MALTKFGRYDLLERIGTSEVAEIYRARSLGAAGFEKIVAIKRIQPRLEAERDFVELFTEEARISASLTHAHIAQVIEFGRIDGAHYLAMEYLNGMDLAKLLRHFAATGQVMPLPLALHIGHSVASALAYAHSRNDSTGSSSGILHLGVNPKNVVISYEGAVKLTDFGIGRARERLPHTDEDRAGRVAYMSPEQLSGEPVDRRSDVFSLGCLLYECAVGQRAFGGEDEAATERQIRKGVVTAPRLLNSSIPPRAEEIILRALDCSPGARYQTAAEMEHAIEAFAHEARLTFNAKQLARWMQRSFPAPTRRPGRADGREEGQSVAAPPPRMRLAQTRPGAVSAPVLVRAHQRGGAKAPPSQGAPASDQADAVAPASPSAGPSPSRPLKTTVPGHPSPTSGATTLPPTVPTDRRPSGSVSPTGRSYELKRTRIGLGPPVAIPSESTVALTEADLREAESEHLLATADETASEPQPQEPPALAAAVEGSSQRESDGDSLAREAEAMEWDDGPTVLDPRDEASFAAPFAAPASAEPISSFVISDEHLEVATRVEQMPAALLAETLPDGHPTAVATPEVQLSGAAEPHPLAVTLPMRAADSETPDQPLETMEPEKASSAAAVPLAESVPAAPLAPQQSAGREGVGILLPVLAIVSLILLVAGGVLIYVLVTRTDGAAIRPAVRVAPAADDEQEPLTTRALDDEAEKQETPEEVGKTTAAETKPAEGTETKPAEGTETKPAEGTETKPAQTKPASTGETKPTGVTDTKPTEASHTKPAEPAKAGSPLGAARVVSPGTTSAARTVANSRPTRRRRRKSSHRPARAAQPNEATKIADPGPGDLGYLIVASRPTAEVLIDGVKTGRQTPIRPNDPLRVKPGTHRVTLVARGKRFDFTVTIEATRTSRLVRVLPLP